jgi:hypothetical protein
MRCRLCRRPAPWFRRRCATCAALWNAYASNRGASPREMMALFAATGAASEHIDLFLQSDPDGAGTIRDRIAAEMTNQLLEALGQVRRQTPEEVRRLRERGLWKRYDQRPEE